MDTRTVHGDGVDLAVYERGDPAAPTVLLVHGYPDTHAVWDPVARRLDERFHVVTYDVRGAGASSHPSGRAAYTFERLMGDLTAVLDAVSPDRPVHLVGHDWGSIQCWEAVCLFGDRFASFTSVSGPCLDHLGRWLRTRSRGPRGVAQVLWQGLHSWYIAAFQTPVLPELVWRVVPARLWGGLLRRFEGVPADTGHPARTFTRDAIAGVNLYRADMRDRLRRPHERRTEVPTQIIVATKDAYVTPKAAEAARPWVRDLRISPVPAPHWVQLTSPGVVAGLVVGHIDRTGDAGPDR